MSITFKDFLDSAQKLVKSNDEVDHRNAASRAYYAAFHEAKRVSKYSNSMVIKNQGVHEQLIQKLKTHPGKDPRSHNIRDIGNFFSQCKSYRVRADYHINKNFPNPDALKAISIAEQIINLSLPIQ